MNAPEHHADPAAASDLSRRDFTRLAATALVGSLPVGLIGCAQHEVLEGKGPGRPLSCAKFLDPVHDTTVSITPLVTSKVKITVQWQNNGCNLSSGVVSVFLVKGTQTVCAKQSFNASTAQPIVFPFTGTLTFFGQHTIKCYITGTATDGSVMDPMAHGHGTAQHCS